MSADARFVACNCTGMCRPSSQGGRGYCSSLPRPIPAPVCNLCQKPWEAGHDCTTQTTQWDRDFQWRNCPCRPENGGSGICGCILGGPQVTC